MRIFKMANCLIVYISGVNNSLALKKRLESKGHSVDNGEIKNSAVIGVSGGLGSKLYKKVYLVGHKEVFVKNSFRVETVGGLPTHALLEILMKAGLKEPEKIILICCKAAVGSKPGNTKEDNIGYSLGHKLMTTAGENGWFKVVVVAYNHNVGIIDEKTHELMEQLSSLNKDKDKSFPVLNVGSRYIMGKDSFKAPKDIKGSKYCFFYHEYVLYCAEVY
jgi:hypothetical protein